jgi:hypothetical protein
VVEVNVHSPTWVQAAQALGQSPTATADAAAPPQWRVVAEGSRWSWREFRNRPPDDEPLSGLVQKGRPFPVRHWAVPLLVGDKRVSVTGVTDFVPRAGTAPKRGSSVVPVVVGLGTFALAFVTVRRRRPGRSR